MWDKLTFDALATRLLQRTRVHSTLLIAVDGGGGAGKSTFAASLCAALTAAGALATVVPMDDFFRPHEKAQQPVSHGFVDGEMDWQRLREQVIAPLKVGHDARYQRFDWPTRTLQEWHAVPVGGSVIVEGVGVLRQELAACYDFKVWVRCPRQRRLERGVARDGEQARERWERQWLPADERFVQLHHPENVADLVVDGSGDLTTARSAYFVCVRGC